MSHILIERAGGSLRVPEATVADVISLVDHQFDKEKKELLADLADVDASDELKFDAVRKLRSEKGLTSNLIKGCFSLAGAVEIIKFLVPIDMHDAVLEAEADELVWLALRLLGFDVNDDAEAGDGDSASPTKDRATSTKKL